MDAFIHTHYKTPQPVSKLGHPYSYLKKMAKNAYTLL